MGAKLLSYYTEVSVLVLPAFPLDEKQNHLSLTPTTPRLAAPLWRWPRRDGAARFRYLAKGVQRQSSVVKNHQKGYTLNSPCSVSINSFLIQLLWKKPPGVLRGYVLWFGCLPIQ